MRLTNETRCYMVLIKIYILFYWFSIHQKFKLPWCSRLSRRSHISSSMTVQRTEIRRPPVRIWQGAIFSSVDAYRLNLEESSPSFFLCVHTSWFLLGCCFVLNVMENYPTEILPVLPSFCIAIDGMQCLWGEGSYSFMILLVLRCDSI